MYWKPTVLKYCAHIEDSSNSYKCEAKSPVVILLCCCCDELSTELDYKEFSLWGIVVLPDLVLFISFDAGVKHDGLACFACKQSPILGMCWRCLDCKDLTVNLCTSCYMADEHDIQHVFHRRDSSRVEG